MEKFKDGDINAMSIIVDSIKYHSKPYMYDALTNLEEDVRCPNKPLLSQTHWTSNESEE
jgi:hypothetical protein